jgi:hypothetical protein
VTHRDRFTRSTTSFFERSFTGHGSEDTPKQTCCWGEIFDAVILNHDLVFIGSASAETISVPPRIVISEETSSLLSNPHHCVNKGTAPLKGSPLCAEMFPKEKSTCTVPTEEMGSVVATLSLLIATAESLAISQLTLLLTSN